jgi:serine/threonine protein kinase
MMIASMQPYRFSVDWFNVGVLLHVMLTGKHPFRVRAFVTLVLFAVGF